MFTGIIQHQGIINRIIKKKNALTIVIATPPPFKTTRGESITINGICSTVISTKKNTFTVQYMKETLRKTTVAKWALKDTVNLERSMTASSLIGGHLITGHIDTVGKIVSIQKEGESKLMHIKFPGQFRSYCAPKGSVAVDGISLTVIEKKPTSFTVGLIPYTLTHTNLGAKKVKDFVDLEFDLIAKYLKEIVGSQKKSRDQRKQKGVV